MPRVEADGLPQGADRIDLLAFLHGHRDGHVGEAFAPVADHDVGAAGHGGMNGALGEHKAEHGIGAVGRASTDLVGGVEILHVDLESGN